MAEELPDTETISVGGVKVTIPKEVSVDQAAKILGVARRTVTQYMEGGLLEWRDISTPKSSRPTFRLIAPSFDPPPPIAAPEEYPPITPPSANPCVVPTIDAGIFLPPGNIAWMFPEESIPKGIVPPGPRFGITLSETPSFLSPKSARCG